MGHTSTHFVDTSMQLHCYFAFVLPILEYCSPMWGSAAECHLQLLEHQVYWGARLGPDQSFLLLCHWRCVAGLSMLYEVNVLSNYCLFSELPYASIRVCHTHAVATAHPLEFEVSRSKTSQFARCFLLAQVRIWNDLPYTVFDTGMLEGFKGAVNRRLLPSVVFSFSMVQVLMGLRKQFINNFVFPTLECAAGFNKNNNNNVDFKLGRGYVTLTFLC